MVESSRCSSRLYPDIEAPVDPSYDPIANAQSERWPLTAQQGSYNAYYVPPSYGEPPVEQRHCHHQDHRLHRHSNCNHPGFVCATLRLALFHAFNAVLGVVAFVAVITGVDVAIGLTPLCCVGLLVFRGVVVLVQWLATLDVKLSNYVASADGEHVLVADVHEPLGGFVGLRLSPQLSYFSPVSLLGTLYFSTVKLVLSIVSLVVVSVFASLPILLLGYSNDDSEWLIKVHHHKTVDLHEYPFTFYILWGCLFILSVVAMHVMAWISCAATHFFCCERVTAPEYNIPVVEYPATAATATMYGSSIPTSRTHIYYQSQ
ncbi:hypothetical protein PF005_g12204 [Phytophthora fragariae]|uniref:Uncharacterized protein n=1 Tax=Phytophthora fragariae TaxID=53985 RepID=A0A6A3K7J4_9STRA|nr:hypothetical protein PF003_g21913 [Phytophthora fragariae]KAE8934751.1 hypothetical protein PF009_g15272 [Phytophthora fragariae]KAE9003129.1 hypothetical protein PF011_g13025 [Phytophthora fragariae]KAE9103750.1 hypothetical protein PF007_g14292 [Phytophthora fragariae]KAE9108873.1 hypothetical protein PF010_g11744 [Phytophthora fragariae]